MAAQLWGVAGSIPTPTPPTPPQFWCHQSTAAVVRSVAVLDAIALGAVLSPLLAEASHSTNSPHQLTSTFRCLRAVSAVRRGQLGTKTAPGSWD